MSSTNSIFRYAFIVAGFCSVFASTAGAQGDVFVANTEFEPVPVTVVTFDEEQVVGRTYVFCNASIVGTGAPQNYQGCLSATAVGFGVGRDDIRDSSKAGTQDINIGVGKFSSLTIEKATDVASAELFKFAVTGVALGRTTLYALEEDPDSSEAREVMEITLNNPNIKSMHLDPKTLSERLELQLDKIQIRIFAHDASGQTSATGVFCWDSIKNKTCTNL